MCCPESPDARGLQGPCPPFCKRASWAARALSSDPAVSHQARRLRGAASQLASRTNHNCCCWSRPCGAQGTRPRPSREACGVHMVRVATGSLKPLLTEEAGVPYADPLGCVSAHSWLSARPGRAFLGERTEESKPTSLPVGAAATYSLLFPRSPGGGSISTCRRCRSLRALGGS